MTDIPDDPMDIMPIAVLRGGRGGTPYYEPVDYPGREARIVDFTDGALEPTDGPPSRVGDPASYIQAEPGEPG